MATLPGSCTLRPATTSSVRQAAGARWRERQLNLESQRALEMALQLCRNGVAHFADCLYLALAAQAGESPLCTFDSRAASFSGAQMLSR